MNELPTDEPVNGKKMNIRQILSVEEFDTQHIRICIHRILISIYFIAVSQLHQMQSIHRTMHFSTHPDLKLFNSLHPFLVLVFVLFRSLSVAVLAQARISTGSQAFVFRLKV